MSIYLRCGRGLRLKELATDMFVEGRGRCSIAKAYGISEGRGGIRHPPSFEYGASDRIGAVNGRRFESRASIRVPSVSPESLKYPEYLRCFALSRSLPLKAEGWDMEVVFCPAYDDGRRGCERCRTACSSR